MGISNKEGDRLAFFHAFTTVCFSLASFASTVSSGGDIDTFILVVKSGAIRLDWAANCDPATSHHIASSAWLDDALF